MAALALYYIAVPVGAGSGYIIGSFATSTAQSFEHDPFRSWLWSLRVTPALGLVLVLLAFVFVMEPQRGHQEGGNATPTEGSRSSLKEDLVSLLRNKTLMLCCLGCVSSGFSIGALSLWTPKILQEAYLAAGKTD